MTNSGKNGHEDDYTPAKTHEHAGADVYITTDEESGEKIISYGDQIREEMEEKEEEGNKD
jgi:hypothetical protein